MDEIRKGCGYKWKIQTSMGESEGYTIDNLDKKTLEDGKNDFERTFVAIRQALLKVESLCLDNEEERLQVCQVLSREIDKAKRKIYRDLQSH